MSAPKQAVILVGGHGTRLGDLVARTPKPMLEIRHGRRFLDYLLDALNRHGFTQVLMLAGYLGDLVEQVYDGKSWRGMRMDVVREPEPAGTAGALLHVAGRLEPHFLMCNGDSFFDINYLSLTEALHPGDFGVLALRRVPDGRRYGVVDISAGRITGFHEKDPIRAGEATISGGVYLLSRDVVHLIERVPYSIEANVFPRAAENGGLAGKVFNAYFIDIGLPESLQQGREELGRQTRPAVFFDRDGCLIHDDGYRHKIADLRWRPGAIEAVRLVNDRGGLAITVTNQVSVGRGYCTEDDMHAFYAHMQHELRERGAHVDAHYFYSCCAETTIPQYRVADHADRKSNAGKILKAMSDWAIDLQRSLLVGDQTCDLAAAAGVKGVLCDDGRLDEIVRRQWPAAAD